MRSIPRLLFIGLLLTLPGCSSFYLPKPASPESTILVLPFTVTNNAQRTSALSFHYIYEIERLDNTMEPLEVRFTRRLDADIMTIASLLPGAYRISSFNMVPAGAGDHTYGDRYTELDLRFTLEAGKITIFMRSLNLEMYNSIPGRGSSTSYSISLDDVTPAQFEGITRALTQRPTYKHWQILTEPPQIEDGLAGHENGSIRDVSLNRVSACRVESLVLESRESVQAGRCQVLL